MSERLFGNISLWKIEDGGFTVSTPFFRRLLGLIMVSKKVFPWAKGVRSGEF